MCLISTLLNEKRQDMWNKNEFIVINALPHCFKSSPLVHLPLRWWAEKRRPLPSNYTQKKKSTEWLPLQQIFSTKRKNKRKPNSYLQRFYWTVSTQPASEQTHWWFYLLHWTERVGGVCVYLGVRISLYCSFSTLVVAATDMGMTMLLISKELSPRLLLMGCSCRAAGTIKCKDYLKWLVKRL